MASMWKDPLWLGIMTIAGLTFFLWVWAIGFSAAFAGG